MSERVVFNGYFLKIWKYEAADTARGAPLLVGRIGRKFLSPSSSRSLAAAPKPIDEEIDPVSLDAWVRSVGSEEAARLGS